MRARMVKRVRYVCQSRCGWVGGGVGFSAGIFFSVFAAVDFAADVLSTVVFTGRCGRGVDRDANMF